MKKSIIYPAALVCLFAFSACDNQSSEQGTTVQEQPQETSPAAKSGDTSLSREDHLKLVKAEEVTPFGNVNSSVQNSLQKIAQQYLQIKEALVSSEAGKASQAAAQMQKGLQELEHLSLEAAQTQFLEQRTQRMQEHLQQIEASGDLLQQREHFARLTKATTELVTAFEAGKGSLYYQYCPMAFDNKGGYWLSDSKEIKNPYYPKEMLGCGRVAKTL